MRILRPRRRHTHDEHGAALPFIAVIMVLLLGMAAFAIDLGWIFLNGSRIQRAADSAALAGVIYLPGDLANVRQFAVNGAQANGYDIGAVNGAPTGSGGPDSLDWTALADNKLQVRLESSIETFFLKVLGFDSFDIARVATAEYVKPVPMGSPDPCFGIGEPSISGDDCNPAAPQRFWAAVSGPFTNKHNGDAYSTRWFDDVVPWDPPESPNPEYRTGGYYLAVEVPPGVSDLDVDLYDAAFWDRGSFDFETGDFPQDTEGGADTHFQMYHFDATPLDPTDNPPISGCRLDLPTNTAGFENRWVRLCSLTNPAPGLYVVRIWTDGDDGGTNQYAVRANTTGGGDARVYGINDISIFTNQSGISTLHIAEVIEAHQGKILELEFYDPGEDNLEAFMTVQRPDGATAQCNWEATDEDGSVVRSGSGNCRIKTAETGTALFNGLWVRAQIAIGSPYVCAPDCWWKMIIENSQPHDRTTWKARVIGNPVRLTPNP